MLAQSIRLAWIADRGRTEESGVTYGTCGQDHFFRSRDGILDTSGIDKDTSGSLAAIQNDLLHLRRLIEIEIGRLTQGLAQE